MEFSDRIYASIFLDSAAIFLLLGMILFTSIYRKRGRVEDRIFFLLLLSDLMVSVCDITVAIVNGRSFAGAKVINLAAMSLFYIEEGIIAYLLVLFCYQRIYEDQEKSRRLKMILLVPIVLVELFYAIGVPNGLLITVDAENHYHYGKFYLIPLVVFGGYALLSFVLALMYKIKRGNNKYIPIGLYLLPIALGGIFPYAAHTVALTPIAIAVMYAFLHMGIMNEAFFGEEGDK